MLFKLIYLHSVLTLVCSFVLPFLNFFLYILKLLGKDTEEIHLFARVLYEKLGIQQPLILTGKFYLISNISALNEPLMISLCIP